MGNFLCNLCKEIYANNKKKLKNETLNLRLVVAIFSMFTENELVLLHIIP